MAQIRFVMLASLAVGAVATGSYAQSQVRMEDPGSSWRVGSFSGGTFRAEHNGLMGDIGYKMTF